MCELKRRLSSPRLRFLDSAMGIRIVPTSWGYHYRLRVITCQDTWDLAAHSYEALLLFTIANTLNVDDLGIYWTNSLWFHFTRTISYLYRFCREVKNLGDFEFNYCNAHPAIMPAVKRQTQITQTEGAHGEGTLCYIQKGQLVQRYLQLTWCIHVVTKVLELKCSILCPITHVLVYHLKFSYFFLRSTTNLVTIKYDFLLFFDHLSCLVALFFFLLL